MEQTTWWQILVLILGAVGGLEFIKWIFNRKTENRLIFIERDEPIGPEVLAEKLAILRAAVSGEDNARAKAALHEVVPTFHRPEEVNRTAQRSEEMKIAEAGVPAGV